MSSNTQKKWLTTPKGRLSRTDLSAVLGQEAAWSTLSRETRQKLYDLLPPPPPGEEPWNVDVHPFETPLRPYIEEELRRWQGDLKDGKETKGWRDQAMEAGKERVDGVWDGWKEAHRQKEWGRGDENAPPTDDEEIPETDGEDELQNGGEAKYGGAEGNYI